MSPTAADPRAPSGRIPVTGVLLLLLVASVATLGVGWLYHIIGRFFDLIAISPLIGGAMVGFAIMGSARPARCRSPRLVIVLAGVCGILMIFCRLYFDSLDVFGNELSEAIATQNSIPLEQAQQEAEQIRKRLGPFGMLKSFIEMQADNGIVIEDTHSYHKQNTPITGGGYYFLLGISVLLASLVAAIICGNTYQPGYCERCDKWLGTQQLGMADVTVSDALVEAVVRHDWQACRQMQQPYVIQTGRISYLTTILHSCERCEEGYIQVEAHLVDQNRRQTVLLGVENLSAAEVASAKQSAT